MKGLLRIAVHSFIPYSPSYHDHGYLQLSSLSFLNRPWSLPLCQYHDATRCTIATLDRRGFCQLGYPLR